MCDTSIYFAQLSVIFCKKAMDKKLKKSEKRSNEVSIEALKTKYGQITATTTDDFCPYDLDVVKPDTLETEKYENKYRKYLREELERMPNGIAVEKHKAVNPINKNTKLLVVTIDGYALETPITAYTSESLATHNDRTETDYQQKEITTDWVYYDKFDDMWLVPKLHQEYLEAHQQIKKDLGI